MTNVCEVVGSGQHISEILRDGKPVAIGRKSRIYRIIAEGRLLAVKVLPLSSSMALEVELMSRLSGHRFVPSMRGLVESQDSIYITTDFFPVSCKQMIDEIGPLSVADLKKLAIQMIQILSLLHEWGFIHRDFTLDKVRFKSGAYALCSFSHAQPFGDTEACNSATGLEYSAPEVLEQHRVQGPEIDIWSLGVCLFYLSCGSFPFTGENAEQVLLSIHQGLHFPAAIESARLRDLLTKLLMYNPQDRIPLQEVLLHPFLTGGKLPRVRTQRATRCHTDTPASGEPIVPVSSDCSLAMAIRPPDGPPASACSSSSDHSVSTTRRFRIPVGKVTLSLPSFLRLSHSSHS